MEEEKIGEQPVLDESNVQSEIVKSEDEGTTLDSLNETGSLGKFKDAESLLNAYNSLQAEFTRKCQKLSDVTKELEENKSQVAESEPVYASKNWRENVSNFLAKNSEAQKYSGEIATEILNDEKLQSSPNALELAWARVMQKNYVEPAKLANDQNFINEQILSRNEIKMQVLEEYFKNLQKQKNPPVISGSGEVAVAKTSAPTNMAEAKQMVEKIFNIKG